MPNGRYLFAERLETRVMLAADLAAVQNFASPEDVNADGVVSPRDALLTINDLNSVSEGEASPYFLDVSGDGLVSPLDVLGIVNRVNRGPDAPSGAAVAGRIANAQRALESGQLPAHIPAEEAQDLLATLLAGGRPEIGERLISGRIINVSLAADIVDSVAEFGVGAGPSNVLEAVADLLRSLDDETPLLDQIIVLLDDLGVEVGPIQQSIDNILAIIPGGVEAGASSARELLDQLRSALEENHAPIRDALADFRDQVLERPVGERFPGLREAFRDGRTPLQDLLSHLSDHLEQPAEVTGTLESFIDRVAGVSVPLTGILSNLFVRS